MEVDRTQATALSNYRDRLESCPTQILVATIRVGSADTNTAAIIKAARFKRPFDLMAFSRLAGEPIARLVSVVM
jgi:hypothetical protein